MCTVFRQPRPLPEGALSCLWPTDDCIVYYRTGGVRGDNSIVYDFLRSSRQVDCAHKTLQLTDLSVLIHSLAIQRAQLNIPLSTSPTRIILTHQFGVDSALADLLQARSTELNWPGENLYYHWFQVGLYTGKEGRDSSVDRARDPWWGGRGFDPYSCQTLSLGWVGVSIMLPSWLPRSVSCVAARKIVRLQSWDPSADIA